MWSLVSTFVLLCVWADGARPPSASRPTGPDDGRPSFGLPAFHYPPGSVQAQTAGRTRPSTGSPGFRSGFGSWSSRPTSTSAPVACRIEVFKPPPVLSDAVPTLEGSSTRGLENEENSCWLLSLVQAIAATPELRGTVQQCAVAPQVAPRHSNTLLEFFVALNRTITQLETPELELAPFNPRGLRETVWKLGLQGFTPGRSSDPAEFLSKLVSLSELAFQPGDTGSELAGLFDRSPLTRLTPVVTLPYKAEAPTLLDAFNHLAESTVHCLFHHTGEEKVNAVVIDELLRKMKAHDAKLSAYSTLLLPPLPETLIVNVSRQSNQRLEIPLSFDVGKLLKVTYDTLFPQEQRFGELLDLILDETGRRLEEHTPKYYELRAALVHVRAQQGLHWVTLVNRADRPADSPDSWYFIDDAEGFPVDMNDDKTFEFLCQKAQILAYSKIPAGEVPAEAEEELEG